jgi:hypothetical protein
MLPNNALKRLSIIKDYRNLMLAMQRNKKGQRKKPHNPYDNGERPGRLFPFGDKKGSSGICSQICHSED